MSLLLLIGEAPIVAPFGDYMPYDAIVTTLSHILQGLDIP